MKHISLYYNQLITYHELLRLHLLLLHHQQPYHHSINDQHLFDVQVQVVLLIGHQQHQVNYQKLPVDSFNKLFVWDWMIRIYLIGVV